MRNLTCIAVFGILIATEAFASEGATTCRERITENAAQIETQAKSILQEYEAAYQTQLQQNGEANKGMAERDKVHAAQVILRLLNNIKDGSTIRNAFESAAMQDLCKHNLSVEEVVNQ